MSTEATAEDEIELKHTYANTYTLHPATGVTGGRQPQGGLKIDFVYDHTNPTTSEFYSPEGDAARSETADYLEREHQVGVTMDPQNALHSAVHMLSVAVGDDLSREEIYEWVSSQVEVQGEQGLAEETEDV